MPVTKVIDVIGSSPSGSDDAVREALRGRVALDPRHLAGSTSFPCRSWSRTAPVVRWDALVKVQFPVEPR